MSILNNAMMAGGSQGIVRLITATSLSSEVAFTRASTATYFNVSGVLQTAISGAPRFGSQVIAGTNSGYISEDSRTNNALYSRDFTQTAWVKTSITTALNAIGIDSIASSASTLTATGANGTALQTVTIASAAYTFSIYVKRKTGVGTIFITDDNTNFTDITSSINSSTFTQVTLTRTQANPIFGFKITTSGDEIIVDAAQLEAGAFNSTFIPTTTVAATRQRDLCSIASVQNKSWFNINAYTVFIQYFDYFKNCDGDEFAISDGTLNNRVSMARSVAIAGGRALRVVNGGVASVAPSVNQNNFTTGAHKEIFANTTNDSSYASNGVNLNTDSSVVMPLTVNTFYLGNSPVGVGGLFGTIQSLIYYPQRIPDARLLTLTA